MALGSGSRQSSPGQYGFRPSRSITGIDTAAWWPVEALETLAGIGDESYDFVHSSHDLALVPNCFAAIR